MFWMFNFLLFSCCVLFYSARQHKLFLLLLVSSPFFVMNVFFTFNLTACLDFSSTFFSVFSSFGNLCGLFSLIYRFFFLLKSLLERKIKLNLTMEMYMAFNKCLIWRFFFNLNVVKNEKVDMFSVVIKF